MLMSKSAIAAGLLGLGMATSAAAGSHDAVIGAVIGAGVGAAVGHNVDGRSGALIGSAIGAVAGTAIATGNDRDSRHDGDRQYRDVRYAEPEYRYVEPPRYRQVVYRQPVYVTPVTYPVRAVTYYEPRPVKVKYRYYDNDNYRGHKHWRQDRDEREWRRDHRGNDRDRRWD